MIYAGKIQDSKTVSAVLAYSNMINNNIQNNASHRIYTPVACVL